jgi:ATP-dependent HslUV protease, peptidase subunit HslV
MEVDSMSAEDVAKKAMRIATDMCVYTNDHYMIETMDAKPRLDDAKK